MSCTENRNISYIYFLKKKKKNSRQRGDEASVTTNAIKRRMLRMYIRVHGRTDRSEVRNNCFGVDLHIKISKNKGFPIKKGRNSSTLHIDGAEVKKNIENAMP